MDNWKTLIRPASLKKLLDNYHEQLPLKGTREEVDFHPVTKLFNPTGGGTWLLTECNHEGLAFGLADLGFPELGYVSMTELREFRGLAGLGIEEDTHFHADRTLSQYASDAQQRGYIRA